MRRVRENLGWLAGNQFSGYLTPTGLRGGLGVASKVSRLLDRSAETVGARRLVLAGKGKTSERSGASFRQIRVGWCDFVSGSPETSFWIPRWAVTMAALWSHLFF